MSVITPSTQHLRSELWRLRDRVQDLVLRSRHRRRVFERIYAGNLWGDAESVSGGGSSDAGTRTLRERLPALLHKYGVRTLLDAPCGDFLWMRHIVDGVDQYWGADIVPALIARNTALHGTDRVKFVQADITTDPLPRADLVLCRDCFIHLPGRLINDTLSNFRSSGASWVLLTHDVDAEPYREIPVGSFRRIDFTRGPFFFPSPEFVIRENDHGRQLSLWPLSTLPLK